MSLWKIAWRSIQQRALSSSLTAMSMALGVMLVVAVLVSGTIVEKSFNSANSLGYNIVIGAKGGRLDLLLNAVYYLNRPIGNIPWEYYEEFLPASARKDGAKGNYSDYVDQAIPICLGDFLGDERVSFRVVGAPPELFTNLLKSKFSSGGAYRSNDFATAVIGADVAKSLDVKIGGDIKPMHGGVGGEVHMPFKVTGILERTGTPNDRAAFVNIEGFFLIPDHAKDAPKEDPQTPGNPRAPSGKVEPADELLKTPLPGNRREVTAVLVRTKSIGDDPIEALAPYITTPVNKELTAQAIEPVREIEVLTGIFVRPAQLVLIVLTILIVIISAVSILVSIYNSMSERRHEIAVMRSLGARRTTVMAVVLLESILLALGGGTIGWLLGHLLVGAAGPFIVEYTGVSTGWLEFAPFELTLIPGLIALATIVGYLPALAAYRTDVGKSLAP